MNDWQKRFSQKMELVRDVSRERFAQFARTDLGSVFEEFREFTFQQGIQPTTPIAKPGIQTFKFALTENTFLLLTFRLKGLEHCEMLAEYFVPKHEKIQPPAGPSRRRGCPTKRSPLRTRRQPWHLRTFSRG